LVSYPTSPIAAIAGDLPVGKPALFGVWVKFRKREPRHIAGARGCNWKGR